MTTHLKQEYYVLREGEIQEEPVSREELEAMCRSGVLSADCRIFDPAEGMWRRLGETEFVYILEESHDDVSADAPDDATQQDRLVEAYQRACERVQEAQTDWKSHSAAAELAVSLGNLERARRHFGDALALSPYNPRVAAAVKKAFPPGEWSSFRRLQRAAPVWDDVLEIVLYPIERGTLAVLVPGLVLGILGGLPAGAWVAGALAFAWAVMAAHAAAWGENPAPWAVVRQAGRWALFKTTIAAIEVSLPFFVIAQLGVWLGAHTGAASAAGYIGRSPILMVSLATAALLYLPAAVICAVLPGSGLGRIANPIRLLGAIRTMEVEYVLAAGFVAGWFCLWTLLRVTLGSIPFAGNVITGVTGVYGLLTAMFVLGRMAVRHQEEIEEHYEPPYVAMASENPLDLE